MLEPPRLPPDPPRRHESHDDGDGMKQAAGCLALEGLGCGLMGCLGSAIAIVVIAVATVVALLLS